MAGMWKWVTRSVLGVSTGLLLSGCLSPAPTLARGATAWTADGRRSAQEVVKTPLERVDRNTQAALNAMGVWVEQRRLETGAVVYRGFRNNLEVRVELIGESEDVTLVYASALKNGTESDQRFARSLARSIVRWR